MTQAHFSIPVADVERDAQQRSWPITREWLELALESTDARPGESAGQVEVNVMKNGPEFLVRGRVRVQVVLPCARTLEDAVYDLTPELFLVLRKAPQAAQRAARRERHQSPKAKRKEEAEALLSDEDAARDTFTGDHIPLDPFMREQILLELPMFPLRSDLRSEQATAIRPPSGNLESGAAADREAEIDPRLAPLAEIAEKLNPRK